MANITEKYTAKDFVAVLHKKPKAKGKRWSNSKATVNASGDKVDSGFESQREVTLKLKKMAGQILDYKRQTPYKLVVNGYEIGTYKIDFEVFHLDGTIELEETKGFATTEWKLRWKIMLAMFADNPKYKLTLIKQKENFTIRNIKKLKD